MPLIPLEPTDVTPAWVTAVLRAGTGDRLIVESVDVDPLESLTSTMHRLRLTYADGGPAGPATLIWKQSAIDPAVRIAYGHYRGSAYEREVRFYREIVPTTSARVPRCYLAEYDPTTDEHVLLLEDFGATHQAGDLVADAGPTDVIRCLSELARLHAAHWRAPAPLTQEPTIETRKYFRESLHECRSFLAEIVGPDTIAQLDEVGDLLLRWATQLNRGPLTLIHADAHPGNVLFPRPGAERAVLVDWQGWRVGWPARDVGRALVLMMGVEARRASERGIIAEYCSMLRRNGVIYDEHAAFADYRIGAAYQWNWAVTFTRRRNAWDSPTRAAMPAFIRKAAAAALDVVTSHTTL